MADDYIFNVYRLTGMRDQLEVNSNYSTFITHLQSKKPLKKY